MSFVLHLPVLMVAVPIAVAVLISVLLTFKRNIAFVLSVLTMIFCLISSLFLMVKVITEGSFVYYVSDWPPPWGIEIFIDRLSVYMLLLIAIVGLISIIYSELYIKKVLDHQKIPFYYMLVLFLIGSE